MRQFDPTVAVKPLPVWGAGVSRIDAQPRDARPPVSWRWSRWLINRPWMSGDRFALRLRRAGGDGDPGGMRFARPTGDSSVSCRDSLATRERPLQVPRLFSLLTRAFSLLLSLSFLLLSLSLFTSSFARESDANEIRATLARASVRRRAFSLRSPGIGAGRVCATILGDFGIPRDPEDPVIVLSPSTIVLGSSRGV